MHYNLIGFIRTTTKKEKKKKITTTELDNKLGLGIHIPSGSAMTLPNLFHFNK